MALFGMSVMVSPVLGPMIGGWLDVADDCLDARCVHGDDYRRRLHPGCEPWAAFVPLNTIAFASLPSGMRADGTGLFSLSRNVGSSVGISVFTVLLSRNTQVNHQEIGASVATFNHAFDNWAIKAWLNPLKASGRAVLDSMVTIVSCGNDFKLLMMLSLVVIPLLLFIRPARPNRAAEPLPAMD